MVDGNSFEAQSPKHILTDTQSINTMSQREEKNGYSLRPSLYHLQTKE